MNLLRTAFRFLAPLALLPALLSAATFEGTIDMAIKENGRTHHIGYATKENNLRITMAAGPMGDATAIVDLEAGKILTLIPQMNSYMTIPFDDMSVQREAGSSDELENTGETTTILGYSCTKYIYADGDGEVEIWATEELGSFVAMPKGNPMQGGGAAKSGWEAAIPENFFPMRMSATDRRGRERMTWEVTKVTPQSLPDSLFEVPAGYKEFNMGGLMEGLGGLMGGN
jgi:hypothetical protein